MGTDINSLSALSTADLLQKKEICEIANDNSNGQVVVSGEKTTIEVLNRNLKRKKNHFL